MKRTIFLLILTIFATSANGNVIFSDDFESGSLDQWIIGGRQRDDHGGINIAEVIYRNSSQMAHIHHSLDTTEITLEKLLEYCPNLIFNFDMEVSVSSIAGPTDDDYAMGGAFFDFLDSSGELIGFVRYICSTSSYPFTIGNPSPSREYIALPDSSLHSYSFTLKDILSHITVDTDSIAYINFSFWAYNSGFGWNMSADVWVDNVVVSVPELLGLEIVGPNEVAENFSASYKAIAYYDNSSTRDVTASTLWAVEPNTYASINENGVLTTKDVVKHRSATILASYTKGDVTVEAEKAIHILAICPTGTALQFDGVDDYLDFGDIDEFEFGDEDFSITAWFYTKGKHNYNDDNPWHYFTGEIISKYNWYRSGRQWLLAQDELGYIQFYTNPDGNQDLGELLTSLNGGYQHQWVHVAALRNGSTKLLYINGVLNNTGTTAGVVTGKSSKVYVGCIESPQTGLYHFFNGIIDDVRIYNRALSPEEIQANMHTRLAGDEPNLVGYWDFDEGEGQIVYDLSGNGNNGQLGSTPNPDARDPAWVDSDAPIGICTLYQIATLAVDRAVECKTALLEELLAALAEEWAAYEALEEWLESGDYGDLNKGDIVTAKQKIHSATQHEEQSIDALEKSIEKLKDALSALGYEPEPPVPNQPPNVNITNPTEGAVFTPSQTIEIVANAWDVDGSVVKVEFFADGSKIGEDNDGTDGWKSNWYDHPSGTYSLTAKATDNDEATTTSPAVGITVVELPPPPPPGQASNPNPANGATNVSISADLSWTAGSNAVSHDVYFGTTSPGTFRCNQTAITFDPGSMDTYTTYYWRIDEVNPGGTTTGTVWSFTTTTGGPPPI